MQEETMKISNHLILMAVCALGLPVIGFAKSIQLHEQPKADSKVVGTLDTTVGSIPIFTPKGSEWMKVADPRDGNVGWIKTKDLGFQSVSMNIVSGGDGKQSYRVVQYGGDSVYTPQQIEAEMRRMDAYHRAMQLRMQHMVDDFFTGFYGPQPIFMPVVLVPAKNSVTKSATKH